MNEATSNDSFNKQSRTEAVLTAISPELPVTIDQTVITLTENILEQYLNEDLETNRNRMHVILACLSITLRQTDAYTADEKLVEAAAHFDTEAKSDIPVQPVHEKGIHHARRSISEELSHTIELTRPADYASLAYWHNSIPDHIVEDALNFIDSVPTKTYSGATPSCIFAASIYIAGLKHPDVNNLTEHQVAGVFGISRLSVRNNHQRLTENNEPQLSDP